MRCALALASLVVSLAWLTGCASLPWQQVPLDAASGFYADAELVYQLDAGKLGLPLDVVRVEGRQVAFEQVASSPLAGESIGTLRVSFPHPAGRAGYALASFTLESRQTTAKETSSWNPLVKRSVVVERASSLQGQQPEVREVWELDIETSESNQIFKLLSNLGFYQTDRSGAPARVTVRMQGKQQTKDWDQIPPLNALIQRVRAQGRLVAFARPRGTTGTAITGTEAFRELMARRGTSPPQPAATWSAFAMAAPAATGSLAPPPSPGAAAAANIARGSAGTAIR